jgi:hypothetical protein
MKRLVIWRRLIPSDINLLSAANRPAALQKIHQRLKVTGVDPIKKEDRIHGLNEIISKARLHETNLKRGAHLISYFQEDQRHYWHRGDMRRKNCSLHDRPGGPFNQELDPVDWFTNVLGEGARLAAP